ncbi:MAG TPA: phospholipase domain-containing protein, partial [Pseudoxanthomonas sp.]|nr:phospholipase domain-containing protein [Pseudoxanthomonas sp.]
VAPYIMSEHPAATPAYGESLTARLLAALAANPEVWSRTVFIVNYDENGGFFDHVPPPLPAITSSLGKSTVDTATENYNGVPVGLGVRVPMFVISPWSKGGWVNSQVFDHTSVARFLEQRFGITVDAISPWHRAVCGDLTSCFDFDRPNDPVVPTLPDTSNFPAINAAQRLLPTAPITTAPTSPQPLLQETGVRLSRALPYELHTSARVESRGMLSLVFANTGKQGAVFHVYDKLHLDRIPRRYTVEAGKTLTDTWNTGLSDSGKYELWVYGPNGFVRTFKGDALFHDAAAFQPEIQVGYESRSGDVYLRVRNSGKETGSVTITSNAYRDDDGPWTMKKIKAGDTDTKHWNLKKSGDWYDFTVTSENFERRFAGRVETGKPGVSDPAMAMHLQA